MPNARCSTRPARSLQRALVWLGVALAAGPARPADTIYRCGQTFQQTPCAGAQVLRVDDGRSAAQQREQTEVAQRQQRLADDLAAERQERERALQPQTQAVGIGPPRSRLSEPDAEEDTNPCAKPPRGAGRKRAHRPAVKCRHGAPVYLAPAPAGPAPR